MPTDDARAARLRRLKFRAARRGFLEADLILGRFAADHADALDPAELDELETLLEEADQDLYGWIVGLTPTPARWDTPLMAKLRAFRPDGAAA
jgi:antitoxin CptB